MAIAHRLFHADSHAILDLAAHENPPIGRTELSVLLLTTLLHAAGLEWYEQGAVWNAVSEERPKTADVPPERTDKMSGDLRRLLLADTSPDGPLFAPGKPLATAATWAEAFRQAGHDLGTAARLGTLQRGLRHVISYHVIFHWNRFNLPPRMQAALARAARETIFGPPRTWEGDCRMVGPDVVR